MESSNETHSNVTEPYHPAFVISIAALMLLLSVVTILGNLMVMMSFYIDKAIRQPSNYFIFSLAVSDFIIGLEGFPLYTVYVLQGYQWTMGWFICDLWLSIDYTVCLASIYTVLFITIDRFCSVRIPTAYRNWRTKDRVSIIVVLIWVIPAVLFTISIFGWAYFSGEERIPENECYVQFMNDAIFNMSMYIGYYWSTLVVMIGLYAGIYRTAKALQKKSEQRQKRLSAVAAMQANVAPIGVCLSPINKKEAAARGALLARLSSAGQVIDEEEDVGPETDKRQTPPAPTAEKATLALAPAINEDSYNSNTRLIPSKSTTTAASVSTSTSTTKEGTTTELSKSSSVHSSDILESEESRIFAQNNNQEGVEIGWRKISTSSAQQIGVFVKRARFRAAAAAIRLFQRKTSVASVGSQPLPKQDIPPDGSPGKRRFSDLLFGQAARKDSEPTLLKFQSFDDCVVEPRSYSEISQTVTLALAPSSSSSMLSPTSGLSCRRSSQTQLEQIEEHLEEEPGSDQLQEEEEAGFETPPHHPPPRPPSMIEETISHSELFRVDSDSAAVKTAPVVSPENSAIGNSDGGPSTADSAIKRTPSNDKQYLSTFATPSRLMSSTALSTYNDISDIRYASSLFLTRDRKFDRIRFIDSESLASAATTMSTLASKSIAGRTVSLNLSSRSFSPFTTCSNAQRSSASVQMLSPFEAASNLAVGNRVSVEELPDEAMVVVHPRRKGTRSHSADSSVWTSIVGENGKSGSLKRKSLRNSGNSYEHENGVNVVLIGDDLIEVETSSANKETTVLAGSDQERHQTVETAQKQTNPENQSLVQAEGLVPMKKRTSIFENSPFKIVQKRFFGGQSKSQGPGAKCQLAKPRASASVVPRLTSLRNSGRVSFNQNGRGRPTTAYVASREEEDDDGDDDDDIEYSSTGPNTSYFGDSDKHHSSPSKSGSTKASSKSGLGRSHERRSLLGRLAASGTKPTSTHSLRIPHTAAVSKARMSSSVKTSAPELSSDSVAIRHSSSVLGVETQRHAWSRESSRLFTGLLRGDTTKRLRNGAAGVAQAFRHHGRRVRGVAGNRVRKSKSENRARKALRTITFILGAFVVFWTPFYVLATIYGFHKEMVPEWLYTMSYYMCYLNSPINPFCYAMANAQFKKAFVRMLKGDFHRT